jgi:hypothetical protein
MTLGIEEKVVSNPSATIKITMVSVPASIQAAIAKGLEEGPKALARMYPAPKEEKKS